MRPVEVPQPGSLQILRGGVLPLVHGDLHDTLLALVADGAHEVRERQLLFVRQADPADHHHATIDQHLTQLRSARGPQQLLGGRADLGSDQLGERNDFAAHRRIHKLIPSRPFF